MDSTGAVERERDRKKEERAPSPAVAVGQAPAAVTDQRTVGVSVTKEHVGL
jgi:hypothetical protein